MRTILAIALLVAALLLGQGRWQPPDIAGRGAVAELSDSEHRPVLRENKSPAARDARSKHAPAPGGDLLDTQAADTIASPVTDERITPREDEPVRRTGFGGSRPRAPPAAPLTAHPSVRA